ncbi:hypothetical protein Hbal_0071 [Hirschia baltica ATCC 49814]|uniref:Uncharacterized protein n=2 Tax=Hirschia TaxID=2723 RepID=C6XKH5_HIRBI|nr:hypothetical protein Hbal_0071 [Hirschia baltica ATCC 49814]
MIEMNDTSDSKNNNSDGPDDKTQPETASPVSENTPSSAKDPIDAEFDNVIVDDKTPFEPRETVEKSGPGWGALLTTGAFSAIIGAAISMVATGSSGMDTAKFAPAEVKNQIVKVETLQNDLNDRVQKITGSISELEAKQTSSIASVNAILDERIESEISMREELSLLTSNLELFLNDASITAEPETNAETALTETQNGSETAPNADTETTETVASDTSPTQPSRLAALRSLITRMDVLESHLAASGGDEDGIASTNLPNQLSSEDISTLTQRLNKVEAAEASLKKAMQARSDAIRALNLGLTQTQKAVKSVEADIEELRSEKITASAKAQLERSSLEQSQASISSASIAMTKLEAKSSRGKPFFQAWTDLSQAMPNNDNVKQLENIARRGVPSIEQLSSAFKEMEASLVKKASASQENDGWDWARNALGGVVSVKRTEGEKIDNAGRLQNISNALKASKMDEVVQNAKDIDGPLALEIEDWLEGAQRRLAFDQLSDAIKKDILEQVGVIMPPEGLETDTISPEPTPETANKTVASEEGQ